ncbi:MAG: DUF222 domain-containing protein [Nocardioides sp.]|nr:DUF222 domain-containing protein [Nocardioides sp.]
MIDQLTRPVLGRLATLEADVADIAAAPVHLLSVAERREALLRLTRLCDQIAAARLRVMAAGDDVAAVDGHHGIASWLAARTRADRARLARETRLAQTLDRRWPLVGAGFADGAVNLDQAHVLVAALDALPGDLPADTVELAETHLVAQAARFGPTDLKRLGRRVLDVVAPQIGEDHERRALEVEEARARQAATLFTRRVGDGTTVVNIRLADTLADRLLTCLNAFTSPRQATGQPGEKVPHYRKLGSAFGALIETLDPHRLPLHGGDATTVIVTIDHQALLTGLGAADVGATGRISASEARRLACTANLIPAVLGTASEVLDLGRTARLFTRAQRKALAVRDRTCRAEGCTIPAPWCEAHHRDSWSRAGPTDLANGVLYCSWHHHRAHDPGYTRTTMPNGDTRFHRRE